MKVVVLLSVFRKLNACKWISDSLGSFARGVLIIFYVPSAGASTSMVVIWNSSFFVGKVIEAKSYGIIVEFSSKHTSET